MMRFLVPAAADRAAAVSLGLLATAHALFLLLFLFAAGTVSARAEEAAACAGTDLFAALERDDPAALERLRAEAAATPNGRGLLWRVEKAGTEPSFLFGTMHVTDSRVVALAPAARAAFDRSRVLVIETTDVLDEKGMLLAIMAEPELTMFTDETTLFSLLSPNDRAALEAGLGARGIPLAAVAKMKPWMLAAVVSVPACEMARKAGGAPVLDVKLAADAMAAGKAVRGLESAADQLRAMASLPMDFHVKGLVEAVKLGPRLDDVTETMVALYEQGETGLFWPLFRRELPSGSGPGDEAGFAAFEEAMITRRNATMAERAALVLDEGGAFVAVGALHLPGHEGLVELLRARGFTVSAVE